MSGHTHPPVSTPQHRDYSMYYHTQILTRVLGVSSSCLHATHFPLRAFSLALPSHFFNVFNDEAFTFSQLSPAYHWTPSTPSDTKGAQPRECQERHHSLKDMLKASPWAAPGQIPECCRGKGRPALCLEEFHWRAARPGLHTGAGDPNSHI